jgi:hypothetical protein
MSSTKPNNKKKIYQYHGGCQIDKNPATFNLAIYLSPFCEHKQQGVNHTETKLVEKNQSMDYF